MKSHIGGKPMPSVVTHIVPMPTQDSESSEKQSWDVIQDAGNPTPNVVTPIVQTPTQYFDYDNFEPRDIGTLAKRRRVSVRL
jgi:hypothetical protein